MKSKILLLLIAIIFALNSLPVFAGGVRTIDEVLLPIENSLYLPVRPVTEFFQVPMRWDPASQKALVDGQKVDGKLIAGSFYAPVVELSLALNAGLQWFQDEGRGFLYRGNKSVNLNLPRPPEKDNGPGVILTFDDGPTDATPYILDILDAYNIKAVFFLVGEQVLKHPEIAQRVAAEGHQIGNHSFSHPELPGLSPLGIRQEIRLTQLAFSEIIGVQAEYFRPPYGAWDSSVREITQEKGLQLTWWSINPEDFTNPGTKAMVDRIVTELHPNAIILFHCAYNTAQALPEIINAIWEEGYDFSVLP